MDIDAPAKVDRQRYERRKHDEAGQVGGRYHAVQLDIGFGELVRRGVPRHHLRARVNAQTDHHGS